MSRAKRPAEVDRLQACLPIVRMSLGLTQAELAEKIYASRATVSNIEAQRNNLTIHTYNTIRLFVDGVVRDDPEKYVVAKELLDMLVDHPPEDEKLRTRLMHGGLLVANGIYYNRNSDILPKVYESANQMWEKMKDPQVGYFYLD